MLYESTEEDIWLLKRKFLNYAFFNILQDQMYLKLRPII